MSQDLVLNLVPIEVGAKTIHVTPAAERSAETVSSSLLFNDERDENFLWSYSPSADSRAVEITSDRIPVAKRLIGRSIRDFLFDAGLTVAAEDFIGRVIAFEFSHDSTRNAAAVYKRYFVRAVAPRDQHACKGHSWHLNISYGGEVEITKAALNSSQELGRAAVKAVANRVMKRVEHLAPAEFSSDGTHAVVSAPVRSVLGFSLNYSRVSNKYSRQYDESLLFYRKYLQGKVIHQFITVFESGFQAVSDSQIRTATKDSNLLLFGENHTHYSPYNGLKEYGPYQAMSEPYKFFFVFHKDDAAHANKLYGCLNRGLRGFPGLQRFVGLNLNLDREKTITFTDEDPTAQVSAALERLQFEAGTRYLAIYISRVKKDDPDDVKRGIYYRLKKLFLEKNIRSQVVIKDNIDLDNFNYFLPNIAIAILAKLGGVPWRLSRPIKQDVIVGLGAFREAPDSVFLGTTVAFKNDGTFIKFDSDSVTSVNDLSNFFRSILASIVQELPEIKRLIIHFYKQMNYLEEQAVLRALESFNLRVPYIVATINEEEALVPFDSVYSGRMPTSGTCVVLRRGDYLLCNNTRYADLTGSKIDDFPFPVRIRISRTSLRDLADDDIQQIIDQVYQFSRMYWVSVKQKGKPVTVLYSERVAAASAAFEGRRIPRSDTAAKSLWFL